MNGQALSRLRAVLFKEFVQMRRDRLTFAIMILMPVIQLLIFGYAINTDPRHMPTMIELRDTGPMERSILAGLRASSYFDIVGQVTSSKEGDEAMRAGRAQFLITIPAGFERRLTRGERPQILVAADATDPVAAAGALGAVSQIVQAALARDLQLLPASVRPTAPPYDIVLHRRYNPGGVTALNIVPGLLALILSITLILITSIALTREAERGTLETLLSTPVKPLEVMVGKTVPYLMVALVQIVLILSASTLLFDVPFEGSATALVLGLALYSIVNLILGFLISTFARSQIQAMQMTFFLLLPSVLLSGFMFPFSAMPIWARTISNCLPITHFLRIVRKVLLKGADLAEIRVDLGALAVILLAFSVLALIRYRRTLD
jgi:ABC-2 type transport system permease protein